MRYKLDYRFELTFDKTVRSHQFALKITPRATPFYTIELFETNGVFNTTQDGFGNTISFGNLAEPHERFEILTNTNIHFQNRYFEDDPFSAIYQFPSPLTDFSPSFMRWVGSVKPTSSVSELVDYLKSAIFGGFEYEAGVTSASCSIDTLLDNTKGVCQDFAHLMIATLRYHKIAARYVSGFVTGEGETHAWVEYFDGERWLGVDPTHDILISEEPYIKLAHGRDALDTSVNKGVFIGKANQTMHIYAHMERVNE